jgi:hypothetical protein
VGHRTVKTSTWGGKRAGAGRKKSVNSGQSTVVRIDKALLPAVNALKAKYNAGQGVNLNFVTVIHDKVDAVLHGDHLTKALAKLNGEIVELKKKNKDLEGQLFRQKEVTLVRVKERDIAQIELAEAKARVASLISKLRESTSRYQALWEKEYWCMAKTAAGSRCSNKAVVDVFRDGLLFHLCVQHGKMFELQD